MKLSFKCQYALKTLLELSQGPKRAHQMEEVSKRQVIPLKFLQSIMLNLKNAGFVESRRGPGGGYSLARRPHEIYLGEVIRSVEGAVSPYPRVQHGGNLFDRVYGELWAEVNASVEQILDRTSLEDMLARLQRLNRQGTMFYI